MTISKDEALRKFAAEAKRLCESAARMAESAARAARSVAQLAELLTPPEQDK